MVFYLLIKFLRISPSKFSSSNDNDMGMEETENDETILSIQRVPDEQYMPQV